MSAHLKYMIERAAAVRGHAHAPYSGFHVGACIRAESGRLYSGCNIENAAYPQGQCAEATAIGAMVSGVCDEPPPPQKPSTTPGVDPDISRRSSCTYCLYQSSTSSNWGVNQCTW